MTRRTFVSAPSISLGDKAHVDCRRSKLDEDLTVVTLTTGYGPTKDLIADLYLSTDAAILLRDKLTAALVDAPGTSSPQREPGGAA